MKHLILIAVALCVVGCQTPYRVVGEVDAGAEFRIEQKSDNHKIYGPLRIEEDASVSFDGQYVLVEYLRVSPGTPRSRLLSKTEFRRDHAHRRARLGLAPESLANDHLVAGVVEHLDVEVDDVLAARLRLHRGFLVEPSEA